MSDPPVRIIELLREARLELERERLRRTEPIAVVGMACRFPGGSDSPTAYWKLLTEARSGIVDVPPDRWDNEALYDPDPEAPGKLYVRSGGFLAAVDSFDPAVFGISPGEAPGLDPQQRLLLELTWEALEDAGIPPTSLGGSATGVWIGMTLDDYARRSFNIDNIDAYAALGNARSVAAGRIAYTLGLHGPTLQLDTACSSSLVAVHLACQSLRAGECDRALAGGVNLILDPQPTIALCKLQALSPDGRCRTFDASASGYARGEGGGMVVLERLRDAREKGRKIYGVISGSAINHDGRSNGLTAPNGIAQEALLRTALANAGRSPLDVGFVETHGTGTPLGDPIEVQALARVLCEGRAPTERLQLGAVKSNIGHLEGAAGIAGLIKALLCIQHGQLVPNLHFETPNPRIAWERHPLSVVTEVTPWLAARRVAGVSSFGISGTNAHVLIEQTPEPASAPAASVQHSAGSFTPGSSRSAELLVLSAKTEPALRDMARHLSRYLSDSPALSLDSVASSLVSSRSSFEQRLACVASSGEDLRSKLDAFASGKPAPSTLSGPAPRSAEKLAWLFTGQGAQRHGMGQKLYAEWPAFRDALDEVCSQLDPLLPHPLQRVMWAAPDGPLGPLLDQTQFTQPALFAFEWALARLWTSFGVVPQLLSGHSIGEISAACFAGVLSLPDAATLVAARGRLMQALPAGGAMVAIAASEDLVSKSLLGLERSVAIAAVNSLDSVVISGLERDVSRVAADFESRGHRASRLSVSHAFHSPLMDPMLGEFRAVVQSLNLRPATIPLVSNLSGSLTSADFTSPDYWVDHVRRSVRFADGVRALFAAGARSFLEIGPGSTLLSLASATVGTSSVPPAPPSRFVPSLHKAATEPQALLLALGQLWLSGLRPDLSALFPHHPPRVDLPTYPWQRKRFWIEPARSLGATSGEHPIVGSRVPSAAADAIFSTELSATHTGGLTLDGSENTSVGLLAEWMRVAAETFYGGEPHDIVDLSLRRPLFAGELRRRVEIVLTDAGRSIELHSRPSDPSSARWELHATARAEPSSPDAAVRRSVSEIEARCNRVIAGSAAGEPSLRIGDGELLAEVSLPEGLAPEPWPLHPALLGAALRRVCNLPGFESLGGWSPRTIGRWSLKRTGATQALVHVETLAPPEADNAIVRLELLERDGTSIGSIEHVLLAPGELVERAPMAPPRSPLYEVDWREAKTSAAPSGASETWLLSDVAAGAPQDELAGGLRARGHSVMVVGIDRLRDLPRADHWVCVWSASFDPRDAMDAATRGLQVIQAAHAASAQSLAPLRLWWVTTNAVCALPGQSVIPSGAAAWGFGRTALLELSGLKLTLLDVDASADVAGILASSAHASDDERQLCWRQGRRLVPRLRRAEGKTNRLAAPFASAWSSGGTVLITGGLGGVGLALASGLVERGARHLLLVSRSGAATSQTKAALARLQSAGASISTAAVDVADRAALEALLAQIPSEQPLRAVIHAAGILDDGPLLEQSADRLRRVMSPKVDGAWNLHELTARLSLDHFVLFSSIAGSLGSPGQASYSAANCWLDALAASRRAAGLPATSIAWGPWAEAGMASALSPALRARFARSGIEMLPTGRAIALFDACLASTKPQLVAAGFNLQNVARSLEGDAVPALWRDLVRPSAAAPQRSSTWLDELTRLPANQRAARALSTVRTELGLLLSLAGPDSVPPDATLKDLGLDSLTAVEFRNAVRKTTGVTLPASLAADSPTPEMVSHLLVQAVTQPRATPAAPRAAACRQLTAPGPCRARLFCFHDAGGSADIFSSFERLKERGIEVHTISIERTLPLDAAATEYLNAAHDYVRRRSELPYGFFGHSIGGLLAWAVVQRLASGGEPLPKVLAPSAVAAPQQSSRMPSDADIDATLALLFGQRARELVHLRAEFKYDLGLWHAIAQRCPPVKPLPLRCLAFVGDRDPLYSEPDLHAWKATTSDAFSLTLLPGGHGYLSEVSAREALIEYLARGI